MDIRYFLTGGMFLSGIFSILFGLGYFFDVHSLEFFITVQVSSLSMTTLYCHVHNNMRNAWPLIL